MTCFLNGIHDFKCNLFTANFDNSVFYNLPLDTLLPDKSLYMLSVSTRDD
ncbi:MAG: hypothetical protein ACK521_01720 [bacterium]